MLYAVTVTLKTFFRTAVPSSQHTQAVPSSQHTRAVPNRQHYKQCCLVKNRRTVSVSTFLFHRLDWINKNLFRASKQIFFVLVFFFFSSNSDRKKTRFMATDFFIHFILFWISTHPHSGKTLFLWAPPLSSSSFSLSLSLVAFSHASSNNCQTELHLKFFSTPSVKEKVGDDRKKIKTTFFVSRVPFLKCSQCHLGTSAGSS